MGNINTECRDKLIEALSMELDTRDKRYMFIKCMFPHTPRMLSHINLDGSPYESAWQIYDEFQKQCMVGSLIACFNMVFDSNLNLTLEFDISG